MGNTGWNNVGHYNSGSGNLGSRNTGSANIGDMNAGGWVVAGCPGVCMPCFNAQPSACSIMPSLPANLALPSVPAPHRLLQPPAAWAATTQPTAHLGLRAAARWCRPRCGGSGSTEASHTAVHTRPPLVSCCAFFQLLIHVWGQRLPDQCLPRSPFFTLAHNAFPKCSTLPQLCSGRIVAINFQLA